MQLQLTAVPLDQLGERMRVADARTWEGADRGFAQNFLGAFLLTRLVEERLLASAPARVIAAGSGRTGC